MKIFRGTRNLSPLKISDYYPSNGQFGPGMYFGSEPTQARALSRPGDEGFRVIGLFNLQFPEHLCIRHEQNSSQSKNIPSCHVEITKYEVIIKNPDQVFWQLTSLEVGFIDESIAKKLIKILNHGEIDYRTGVFDVTGIDPSCASIIHAFLVEQGFKVI